MVRSLRWIGQRGGRAAADPASPAARGLRVALAGLLLAAAATTADAKATVKGTAAALEIEARDSSIAEVLDALCAAFHCRYRTSVVLNRPVNGTFRGTARSIVSRLLRDHDYVVKLADAERIEEIIVSAGVRGADSVIVPSPPSPFPVRRIGP